MHQEIKRNRRMTATVESRRFSRATTLSRENSKLKIENDKLKKLVDRYSDTGQYFELHDARRTITSRQWKIIVKNHAKALLKAMLSDQHDEQLSSIIDELKPNRLPVALAMLIITLDRRIALHQLRKKKA